MKRKGIRRQQKGSKYVPRSHVRRQRTGMEPFVHVPEYPFVVCTEGRFACVAGEVTSHLRTKHSHIQASERGRMARSIDSIPGIVQRQGELRSFQSRHRRSHQSGLLWRQHRTEGGVTVVNSG